MQFEEPRLFVTCGQGLEALLQAELEGLGYAGITHGFRGVYVPFNSLEPVYHINYCSRLATRVLLPIKKFRCQDSKALYQEVSEIDWKKYIPRKKTIAIDANVTHPLLKNSLYAAQVTKDAICDQLRERTGERPSVDSKNPDIQLNLFIRNFSAILSFDTSGAPLHKRGYRIEGGLAPLHETLAAALLKMADYQADKIVYDPCCGSGTFLIEAALIATHTPPGYLRKDWGFFYLPGCDNEAWLKIKNREDAKRIPLPKGRIFGTDFNRDAVRITKTNLRAAGFLSAIETTCSDFADFQPVLRPDFVITNPPHGLRLGEEEALRALYAELGDWMKHNAQKPGQGAIFTSNRELAKYVGLACKKKIPVESGGVDCRLLLYDIFEDRKEK